MSRYRTKQGDKWDTIALSQYGVISCVDVLMMANTQHIGTYVFPAGVELTIPEIDLTDTTYSADLPPWKQVNA